MKLGASDKTIFVQGPYLAYRLILASVISLILIFIDVRFNYLDPVRSGISSLLTPIHWLSDLPISISEHFSESFTSRADLQEKIDLMESRMLVLERKAQKLASVTAELNRVRELLNASRIVDDGVVVTEMIGISPDADNQYILLNKGVQDGVYLGQAVLDSQGLMGQVVEVNEFTSRVLLISDSRHAVPVQVNRNGVRAIAYGVGALDYLELGNVPDTSDIEVGDLLVSSGLGGRFPEGYPVARISEIVHHDGRSFAQVRAQPEAQLNRSRLLLLVFKEGRNSSSGKQNEGSRASDSKEVDR
jgi:rod shape-determining protein MreC